MSILHLAKPRDPRKENHEGYKDGKDAHCDEGSIEPVRTVTQYWIACYHRRMCPREQVVCCRSHNDWDKKNCKEWKVPRTCLKYP
jgi:hypothetical protein